LVEVGGCWWVYLISVFLSEEEVLVLEDGALIIILREGEDGYFGDFYHLILTRGVHIMEQVLVYGTHHITGNLKKGDD